MKTADFGLLLRKARIRVAALAYRALFRPSPSAPMVRLGTEYGGWWVPLDVIDENSICYTAGVGTDISFDVALNSRFGCAVFALDPTPAVSDWLSIQDLPKRFKFTPIGVSGEARSLKFYAPANPGHISHSARNLQNTSSYFVAEVRSISDVMRLHGHDRLTLLKLDIEGEEHDAIRQMLLDGIRPMVICVEFDQPEPFRWGVRTHQRLTDAGYDLWKLEHLNLTYVLRAQSSSAGSHR